ncbi:GNAT family N-acetyltransferase [Jatrophihabitans sp. DSM 45814]
MNRFADLSTARLRLTAVAVADLADFHRLHSDPALYANEPEMRHPDLCHSRSVLDGLIEDWSVWGLGYWSVRDAATGRYLGCGGVRRNEVNWNVYYRLHLADWGHGYAVEILRLAAPCAAAVEVGAVLQATIRPQNGPSRRVAEKLGMIFCGIQDDVGGAKQTYYQLPAKDVALPS